jgi:hypothetical protein
VCQHGEGFVKVEIVILPESSAAAWVDMSKSRTDCEVQCKRNCSCSAYAIIAIPGKNYGCLTWYKELVDIIYDRSDSYDLYVRVDAYELGTLFLLSNYFIGLSLQILIYKSFPMLLLLLTVLNKLFTAGKKL